MKKFLILAVLLISTFSYSQKKLSVEAEYFKSEKPEVYQTIKTFSETKWEDQYDMVLYEINKQAKSRIETIKIMKENNKDELTPILFAAVKKWNDGVFTGFETSTSLDWSMVVYEIKKQLEAKNAY